MDFGSHFHEAFSYEDFLDQHASDQQRARWDACHASITLAPHQQELLAGFRRVQRVLCLAGTWCGDCIDQCPILEHFHQASPCIEVRYQDRDHDQALSDALRICGGSRVPVVVFLSEDNLFLGQFGDRTLSRYRHLANTTTGPACSAGLPTQDTLTDQTLQEWLNEFERIQLMLRTSPRLRKKHGD